MTPLSCEVIRVFVLIYARCIGAFFVIPMLPREGMRLIKWVVSFFLALLVCPSILSKVELPWLDSPLCDIPALIFLLVGIKASSFFRSDRRSVSKSPFSGGLCCGRTDFSR